MRISKSLALALVAGLAFAVQSSTADARRWDPIGRCYPAIDGVGTGRGAFGRGTSRARYAARTDWEAAAASRFGPSAARFYLAQDVTWDCKRNAILTAKCVVTAKPCEARIRG